MSDTGLLDSHIHIPRMSSGSVSRVADGTVPEGEQSGVNQKQGQHTHELMLLL